MEALDINLNLDRFLLNPAIPSECVTLFKQGDAAVSLLPVVALKHLNNCRMVTDYGIGCDGPVRTVKLLSRKPISEIEKVSLDFHSRTSVQLLRILMKEYWKINPVYVENQNLQQSDEQADAVLAIGDKVIELEPLYAFQYDLGEYWKKHTGLPFVFAVWVAQLEIADEVEVMLNDCFQNLKSSLPNIREKYISEKPWVDKYFTEHIQYGFDSKYLAGMHLFLSKIPVLSEIA